MTTAHTIRRRGAAARGARGFTLVELLIVLLIILLLSAVALPTIIPALSHRQVNEAARLLQGALVGARDEAIHANAPRGIRLLPDPAFPLQRLPISGAIDTTRPLVANRIVPIEPAPDYTEGRLMISQGGYSSSDFPTPYLLGNKAGTYLYPFVPATADPDTGKAIGCLMVEEVPVDPTGLEYPPTSWFWNIRIGDRIRIGSLGQTFTVVGPMSVFNPELFVNVGNAGTDFTDNGPDPRGAKSPLPRNYMLAGNPTVFQVDFLYLVNGIDDDNDGFIDNGWDGVNNNLNLDGSGNPYTDELTEWEVERWPAAFLNLSGVRQSYTIQRRPVPTRSGRETALPSNVVIDMTTWGQNQERSRLPVDPYTGTVDILLNPSGEVLPTTAYSSPTAFGMAGSFFHFWLAERTDVFEQDTTTLPRLPLPLGLITGAQRELRGESRLITLFTRTGNMLVNEPSQFDLANVGNANYDANFPFVQAQMGSRGAQ